MIPLAVCLPIFIFVRADRLQRHAHKSSSASFAGDPLLKVQKRKKNKPPESVHGSNTTSNRFAVFMDQLSCCSVLLSSMQIYAVMPFALETPFPPRTSAVLKVYSSVSLACLRSIPFRCFSLLGILEMNYPSVMELSSIPPIILSVFLVLAYFIQREYNHLHNMRKADIAHRNSVAAAGSYGCVFFFMFGVIQGGVCCLLSGTSFCIDYDPDDVLAGAQSVMW